MSHKHNKSRRQAYGKRAHEIYERPRTFSPVDGPRIRPFGEGIIDPLSPKPTADTPFNQNPGGVERR